METLRARHRSAFTKTALATAIFATALASKAYSQITVLHTFTGSTTDGGFGSGATRFPAIIVSGSTIYGVTNNGGQFGAGTLYQIATNGSNFNLIHSFNPTVDGLTDGPWGLTLAGSTFTGTAGDDSGLTGFIFSINTDGTGFNIDQAFTSGHAPTEILLQSGGSIVGDVGGTQYQLNPNGTGYTAGPNVNNIWVQSGSTYYATTPIPNFDGSGAASAGGSILSENTDGTNQKTVLSLANIQSHDGATGNLVLSGNTLYQMIFQEDSEQTGSFSQGTLYKVNTDGSDYQALAQFNTTVPNIVLHYQGTGGGSGNILVDGSTIYGVLPDIMGQDEAEVFAVNTDGTDLHAIGFLPAGDASLVLSGNTIYGVDTEAAANTGEIFSFNVPEPSTIGLLTVGAVSLLARRRRRT
jgi:PEP-CTERM motif